MELLPDAALDSTVRALWDRLHAAGLRSLATHTHPTNRPHVTLVGASTLTCLPPLGLPVPVALGEAVLLGRALVLTVSPSPELSSLHARVWEAVGSENPLHAPDRWRPHVSLALNLPPEQREPALALLSALPRAAGLLVEARSYDSARRTVTGI
ncbi:2'-5' RNA ligase family protein [Catenuloplanes sp. NPDC051500]|uniref:2'-5' RNA ligase family protein n=1 Tax=Catenuloplanes sp. NPDC051500 TaxID=3363959 RepID=UPI0037A213E3